MLKALIFLGYTLYLLPSAFCPLPSAIVAVAQGRGDLNWIGSALSISQEPGLIASQHH